MFNISFIISCLLFEVEELEELEVDILEEKMIAILVKEVDSNSSHFVFETFSIPWMWIRVLKNVVGLSIANPSLLIVTNPLTIVISVM